MLHTVLIALLGIATAAALWVRRGAWRRRWETYGTVALIADTTGVLLMSQLSGGTFGALLHSTFGYWHLDDYLAHVCFIVGDLAVVGFAMARLAGSETLKRRIWRSTLIPAVIAVFAMLALFTQSTVGDTYVTDFLTDKLPDAWFVYYWVVFVVTALYILSRAATLTLTLRGDRRSTTVATMLLACIIGWAIASLGMLLQAIPSTHHFWSSLTWLVGMAADIGFAATLAISWRRQPRRTGHPGNQG